MSLGNAGVASRQQNGGHAACGVDIIWEVSNLLDHAFHDALTLGPGSAKA
ncbi:MAG: hypothetical protein ACJATT_001284 [Myxococcota bacterium]|jgi:hypothetical protein